MSDADIGIVPLAALVPLVPDGGIRVELHTESPTVSFDPGPRYARSDYPFPLEFPTVTYEVWW